jgi:hypothetical protein
MRSWLSGRLAARFTAAALVVFFSSCNGGGSSDQPTPVVTKAPTEAEVFAAIVASTKPDSDGDGIPDDVEIFYHDQLGTDATRADTDGDGIDDGMELFGTSWLYVHTQGAAGQAPGAAHAGKVNDRSMAHAADEVDTDGDGVPDVLEVSGYRYDWERARFVLDSTGYHTDPLQWSTDQDAYSDGMEVSGINMDVAVRPPGNHPLVPAYPDISIDLAGYAVTLNETVTYGTGTELERGQSWSREVESTHSLEISTGIETKVSADIGEDLGFSVEATAKFETKTGDTTGTKVSSGGSSAEKSIWNTARSSNPVDAAHAKLYVKMRNLGTAPASNVVPTLSLRIGGADVATFEPADLSVAMLMPGGAFPPDEGVSWVIDSTDGASPLSLTDWELRGLESGAPVTVSVAQKRADVMRLSKEGVWERVGDASDYLARILAVSADLTVDVGLVDGQQGNVMHYRVAADDGATAPPVTIGDAMSWTMGLARHQDGRYSVELPRPGGVTETVYLQGSDADDKTWRWTLDPMTLARDAAHVQSAATIQDMLNLRLWPGSQISLRAPRLLAEAGPLVYSAYADEGEASFTVTTCVADYDGVAQVVFIDSQGQETALSRDGRGPWFFSGTLTGDPAGSSVRAESVRRHLVPNPAGGANISVRLSTTAPVSVVYTARPSAPVIEKHIYPTAAPTFTSLYARVVPGGNPGHPLASDLVWWVRAYHGSFVKADGATEDGYYELKRVTNAFEDPNGWLLPLIPVVRGVRLVAASVGGKYTILDLDDADKIFVTGSITLSGQYDYTANDEYWIQQADLEHPERGVFESYTGDSNTWYGSYWLVDQWKWFATYGAPASWTPAYGMADVYVREYGPCAVFGLGFHGAALRVPRTPLNDNIGYYEALTRADVQARVAEMTPGYFKDRGKEAVFPYTYFDVFLFQTADSDAVGAPMRLGKLLVLSKSGSGPNSGDYCSGAVYFFYTVFARDDDP